MKTLVVAALFSLNALADVVVPDGDPFRNLLELIANWKAMSPVVIGSVIVMIIVQALKGFFGDFPYKRTVVAALSCAYGVFIALSQGLGAVEAIVSVLIVSGGAVMIYESLKPAMKKLNINP